MESVAKHNFYAVESIIVAGRRKLLTCIALSGYYGFYNIGDEAILEAIIRFLRRRLPEAELVVFSADPAHTRRTYGVESVSRTHLPSIFRTLRRADLLISGGGGLLQDVTSLRSVVYYLGIMEMAMQMGKKVAVFAQGMGPLHHRLALHWVKRVLSRVDFVSVRDPLSGSFLSQLGIKREIMVTADPVFSLEPASGEEIKAFWAKKGLPEEKKYLRIGVALRPFPRETSSNAQIMETVARACLYLEKQHKARLIFLPFHLQKDLPLARQIASRLSQQSIIIDKFLTIREIMCLMGGLDLLVGMRLHALIIAAVSGVPFLALPYDPKINAFLSRIGKDPPPPLQELTLQQLIQGLETVLAGKEKDSRRLGRIQELKNEVEKAADELLSLVGSAG